MKTVFRFFFLFLVISTHIDAAPKGGTLEVEYLKLKKIYTTHVGVTFRFINTSPDDIQHWAIGVELIDGDGKYLGHGEGMVSHIRTGQSKIEEILIEVDDIEAIKSFKVGLSAIVGYSGLREDRFYGIKLKE